MIIQYPFVRTEVFDRDSALLNANFVHVTRPPDKGIDIAPGGIIPIDSGLNFPFAGSVLVYGCEQVLL